MNFQNLLHPIRGNKKFENYREKNKSKDTSRCKQNSTPGHKNAILNDITGKNDDKKQITP